MKKIFSSILCLVMILSTGVTSFAETNDFLLSFRNTPSYEITIPAGGEIDTQTGQGVIDIDIGNTNLGDGMVVSVTVSSKNYDDGWYLVNVKDESDKIEYFIGTTENGNDIFSGEEIIAAEGNISASFYITLNDIDKFGVYEDIITFSSEVKERVELISFTIKDIWSVENQENYDKVYQAEKGMTWEEWVDSEYDLDDEWEIHNNYNGLRVCQTSGAPLGDKSVLGREFSDNWLVYPNDIVTEGEYTLYPPY